MSEPTKVVIDDTTYTRTNGHWAASDGDFFHDEGTLLDCIAAITQRASVKTERIESLEKLVSELLAVVHRDGGQHTEAVGLTQSVEDAEGVFHALTQRAEAAEAEAKEWKHLAEKWVKRIGGERDALRKDAARKDEALRAVLSYRDHTSSCEIGRTDFCSCGMREAADKARAALAVQPTTEGL